MTFTVEDFSDLLQILEAHPEWRQKLRQVLFPEIDVSKAFQDLAEVIKRLEIRTEVGFNETEAAMAEVKASQEAGFAEAKAAMAEVKVSQEAGFAKATTEREALKRDLGQTKQDVGVLKGLAHEQFYQNRAEAIFGHYLRRGRNVTEWVADQLQTAQEAGQVSAEEYTSVLSADLLWAGQLRTTKDEVILVLEASWLVESNDIDQAVARAGVLRRLGVKALPVVAGREWDSRMTEAALAQGVVVITNGRVARDSWQAALANL